MRYQTRKARLCAGFPFCDKLQNGAPALTFVEMVIALSIMTIIFSAVLPQFRAIQNSWDSKSGVAETLQNSRVLMDHLYHNLSKAARITAVSDSAETNGYIEFEDNDGSTLRYDIAANNYVEFGAVGSLFDLAGPVSELRFTCYDGNDFSTPITDVNSIRFVKVETTLSKLAALGQDKTFTAKVYLRTNSGVADPGTGTALDEFNSISFSGNDGTLSWSNSWQESGESNGPTYGNLKVVVSKPSYSCTTSNCLCVGSSYGTGTYMITREVDLSGNSSATLAYKWRRDGWDGWYSDDMPMLVQVSSNGGSSWTTLHTIQNGYDTPVRNASYDITSYIATNTQIRITTNGSSDFSGQVYFDDIKVESGGASIRP